MPPLRPYRVRLYRDGAPPLSVSVLAEDPATAAHSAKLEAVHARAVSPLSAEDVDALMADLEVWSVRRARTLRRPLA